MPFEITKTELVWPGKYDEDGKRREAQRASVPFQIIERVNESRATREAEKRQDLTLFDVWKGDEGETFEEGWRNKLIWGDNLLVMSSLLDQFAGKIDLVYIDPPFATGSDFSITNAIGESGEELTKQQSAIEEKAYRDTWGAGNESWLLMMLQRLALMHSLLTDTGVLCLHIDYRMHAGARLLLDEVFGSTALINDIVWGYRGGGVPRKAFARKHDNIIVVAKGEPDQIMFAPQYLPYSEASQKLVRGRGGKSIDGLERDLERGAHMPDWWADINALQTWSPERVDFDTQKPLPLLDRFVSAFSVPGSLVLDCFAGSGTTLIAAERLGRRWMGCDLGRWAIHITRKRLLDLTACKPFEVLNLGKYERQYWQVATFGEDLDRDGSIALYEYVAFILKLYGATAVSGMGSLHGKTGRGFVHVGAVDSPVTIQEIAEAIEECKAVKGAELHVLGWEWEMGVNDLMAEQSKQEGIRLLLRQIPREVMETQAAAKGDVRFFELAYVEFDVKPTRAEREFQVMLKDFAIPNPELVPDDVRAKIKKWSDYVDYWAVDWDFREDTFMQGWVTYRTRKDRSLEPKSDPHTYEESGEFAVMVKVIDIFGNDTSKVVRIQVK